MSSSKLLGAACLAGPPVRVEDLPPRQPSFEATYAAPANTPGPASFPRNWTEVELLLESRLKQFEERHRLECLEAFERGRLEGRREQESEVSLRLQAAAGPWRTLQEAVLKELAAYREELYRGATELSAALARSWLGGIVEVNPHVFEAGMRKALEVLADQEEIVVKLHPEDFACYRAGLHDPDALLSEARGFSVVSDSCVDRGGAIASSRGGTSDARISVRVQKALEWLTTPNERS